MGEETMTEKSEVEGDPETVASQKSREKKD